MRNGPPQRDHRGLRRVLGSRGAWAALGLAALGVAWVGCTVTESNYKTLSFFFDGVPDPTAKAKAGDGSDSTIAAAVISHKPFAEEKCEECHRTQYRPSRNDPSACLKCHDKVMDKNPWTHGAVAGGACIWCHNPHESARKWLLRGPDRKVCAQCHSASMMKTSTVAAHHDPNIGCLECHYGHGGQDALMLRPGASAQGPPAGAEGVPAGGTPGAPSKQDAASPRATPTDVKPEPAPLPPPAPADPKPDAPPR